MEMGFESRGTTSTGALTTRTLTTRPRQLVPYSYKKTTRPLDILSPVCRALQGGGGLGGLPPG